MLLLLISALALSVDRRSNLSDCEVTYEMASTGPSRGLTTKKPPGTSVPGTLKITTLMVVYLFIKVFSANFLDVRQLVGLIPNVCNPVR
jgi:hypothetical protein